MMRVAHGAYSAPEAQWAARNGRHEPAYRKARARVSNVTCSRIISHEPRRMVAAPPKVVSGRTKTAAVTRVDCCRRGRGKESGGGGAVGEVS